MVARWTVGGISLAVAAIAVSPLAAVEQDAGPTGEAAYHALAALPTTAGDVTQLERTAVELADALLQVPLGPDTGATCPFDRLTVSWEVPTGYEIGTYVEPVGPAPGPATEVVSGVVVCDGSRYAFMGFEAVRDTDDSWSVTAVPSLPREEDLAVASLDLPSPPEDAATLPTSTEFLSLALGPIDPYAGYEPQRVCDPTPKPGAVALAGLLLDRYPATGSYGISRDCAIGDRSEHKEGRAFDWAADASDPDERAAVEDLLARLLASDEDGNTHALARRMGVMYVIWDGHIWSSYRPHAGWRPYDGPSAHSDHVHLSLSWDGAAGRTSLWRAALPAGWWAAMPAIDTASTLFGMPGDPVVLRPPARDERSPRPTPTPSRSPSPDDTGDPDATGDDGAGATPGDPTTAPGDTVEDVTGDVTDEVSEVVDDPTEPLDDATEPLEPVATTLPSAPSLPAPSPSTDDLLP